ncbi:hypothetical protein K438DRAFT_1994391 [Mycena galopus ATCC 62051]|nr:hypothetical protein K438DRAFT_1994391 [Mycena galopus ATCC 62051]
MSPKLTFDIGSANSAVRLNALWPVLLPSSAKAHAALLPHAFIFSMIFLNNPRGETKALLREMVKVPDKYQFDLSGCRNGYPHGFELDIGDAVPRCLASWTLLCDGDPSPSPDSAPRCNPQRGPELSRDKVIELLGLINQYTPRAIAVQKVFNTLNDYEDEFAVLHQLWFGDDGADCPPIPPAAADQMGTKLARIRRLMETLNPGDVPDDPEILDVPMSKSKERELDLCSETSDLEGFDSMSENDHTCLGVHEDMLDFVLPRYGRVVFVVIYFRMHRPPYVAKWWAPDAANFTFTAYDFPHSSLNFLAYSVTNKLFTAAADSIDLCGRGKYMIYVKDTLGDVHAPGLKHWKQQARDSAKEERKNAATRPPALPAAGGSHAATREDTQAPPPSAVKPLPVLAAAHAPSSSGASPCRCDECCMFGGCAGQSLPTHAPASSRGPSGVADDTHDTSSGSTPSPPSPALPTVEELLQNVWGRKRKAVPCAKSLSKKKKLVTYGSNPQAPLEITTSDPDRYSSDELRT